jgi:hypothetical protein
MPSLPLSIVALHPHHPVSLSSFLPGIVTQAAYTIATAYLPHTITLQSPLPGTQFHYHSVHLPSSISAILHRLCLPLRMAILLTALHRHQHLCHPHNCLLKPMPTLAVYVPLGSPFALRRTASEHQLRHTYSNRPKGSQCLREAAVILFQHIMMAPRSPGPFCAFRLPLPDRSNTVGSIFELDEV